MIRDEILKSIAKATGKLVSELRLNVPEVAKFGDYTSNVALSSEMRSKGNPREVAEKIVSELGTLDNIEKVEIAGAGFINFFLSKEALKKEIGVAIKEDVNYGRSDWGKNKRWLLEHTSANPNKALHLGHLRNNVTGMAIGNLWEAIGIEVVRDYIVNDRGIAMARLMWGFLKFARKDGATDNTDLAYWHDHQDEWHTPEMKGVRADRFVDELYVLGAKDCENVFIDERVRQMVVDWESEEPKNRALWKLVFSFSWKGQMATLERLGSKTDHFWYEHEHYQDGKKYVEEGLKKGIFKKLEDGAVLTNLAQFGIPDTILLKTDGTSLYITQDIALVARKRAKFGPERMFWVVGNEQSLALEQVFAVCDQLGVGKKSDYEHLTYGYMRLKGVGKMSSREGNVLYIDELIDDAKATLREKIPEDKMKALDDGEALEKIALGALKYSILRTGRTTSTTFDFDSSLSFEGDSGPYIQYAYARAKSLLRKGKESGMVPVVGDGELCDSVARKLVHFPEIVLDAALAYEPNTLSQYLLSLSQELNAYYAETKIIDLEDKTGTQTKLAQILAVSNVLKNGLTILGIPVLEKM